MRQVSRPWLFASVACVSVWLSLTGLAQAQPLPPASFRVNIAQGVQGRIDIGVQPPPLPEWHMPAPVYAPSPGVQVQHQQSPIYLVVPPKHAKKWHKHCHRYGACARPVVLLQPDQEGRRYPGSYWQTGYGHGYKPHKYQNKKEHRNKHRRDDDDD